MTAAAASLSLLLLSAAATIAADAPGPITREELKAEPAVLAMRLLGRVPPELAEARVIAGWSSISVVFLMHPLPAGSAGLCRVDLLTTILRYGEPPSAASSMVVDRIDAVSLYAPTTGELDALATARLPAAQAERCRALTPLFKDHDWFGTRVAWEEKPAQAGEAAFAFRAIAAAARFKQPSPSPCKARAKRDCQAPEPFPRNLDPRDISSIAVTRCTPSERRLCVEAWTEDKGGSTGKRVRVETGEALAARVRPRIRSVRTEAVIYPVI